MHRIYLGPWFEIFAGLVGNAMSVSDSVGPGKGIEAANMQDNKTLFIRIEFQLTAG